MLKRLGDYENQIEWFSTENINVSIGFGLPVEQWETMEKVCNIEIIKDGMYFVVKVHLADGTIREYRHHIFEDVLTEMVIDMQEELSE